MITPQVLFYVGFIVLIANPVSAQPVSFADLDGYTIESEVVRAQVIRREGWQGLVKVHQKWTVIIGPGEIIHMTTVNTVEGPRGKQTGNPGSGFLTLGQPQQLGHMGGGYGVWEFQNGILTYVRTFKQGAFRKNFELTLGERALMVDGVHSAGGFSCTDSESFARERGVGPIVFNSPVDGKPSTLISSKPVSSSCKVVKTK
jgi:hypothetical protein